MSLTVVLQQDAPKGQVLNLDFKIQDLTLQQRAEDGRVDGDAVEVDAPLQHRLGGEAGLAREADDGGRPATRVARADVDAREVLQHAHDTLAVVDHDRLAREHERSGEEHACRRRARARACPPGPA